MNKVLVDTDKGFSRRGLNSSWNSFESSLSRRRTLPSFDIVHRTDNLMFLSYSLKGKRVCIDRAIELVV